MPGARAKRVKPSTKLLELDDCASQLEAIRAGKIEFHALGKGTYPGVPMQAHELPGLSTVGYWDVRRPQDWGLRAHRNEGLEFVFLESGEMGFAVDGENYHLRPGHLTLTRPWQLHKLGDPNIGRGRLYWLVLDVNVCDPDQTWQWPSWVMLAREDLATFEELVKHGATAVWTGNARIREIFREIAACVRQWHEPRAGSRLGIAVNRLLVEVLAVMDRGEGDIVQEPIDHRVNVENFLKELADEISICARQWSVEDMATQCDMGVTTLTKYCSELVNTSPTLYLNLCRIEHAAKLLIAEPSMNITEVALRCGFNSSQYFATAFRKIHRVSPTVFREKR